MSLLYEEIKAGREKFESFYSSEYVYGLLQKYLKLFVRLPHQKTMFGVADMQMYSAKTIVEMSRKVRDYDAHIAYLYENTMSLPTIKRKIKKS